LTMDTLRNKLIKAQHAHLHGHVQKHVANVEVLLDRPAGIGEHQDIQEAIEIELGHIADYEDKLDVLSTYFDMDDNEEI